MIKTILISLPILTLPALAKDDILPPVAKKEIVTFHEHGETRSDPYYWLKNRDTPEVLAYLKAENDYTNFKMKPTQKLQNTLFTEFKNRIKQEDNSLPYKDGNYYYYVRTIKDKAYPLYCRKKGSLKGKEEIFLDLNTLSQNHDYFNIGNWNVSPSENLLAVTEDTVGRREYTLKIKNLDTGEYLKEQILNTGDSFEWSNDSKTLFYTKIDPTTLRSNRVYKHQLGTSPKDDVLVYEEKDTTYYTEISKTKSKKYLMIMSENHQSTEGRFLEADNPNGSFRLFSPRQKEVLYFPDHHQDKFIIRTNDNALNFKLMETPVNKTDKKNWKPFLPYQANELIEDFEIFNDFLAIELRKNGLMEIKILPFNQQTPFNIKFDEPCFYVYFGENKEISSNELRFVFTSLKTPSSIYDYNMQTKEKTLKKQTEIGGGFQSNNYESKRLFAKAPDGATIPVSLVYRKDKFHLHQNPLLLEGYGSYGITNDCFFDPFVISLLDRGFVYALAQTRGGADMGREWYEQGKLLHKKNTFTDFIATAEYLTQEGYASPKQRYATGASAGGLLMGAVMTMRPDLFNGIIAKVPFVDIINTMEDPNIPLTTNEYTEWGSPKDKIYYDYILSYSPYDNIRKAAYPNLLIVSSYQDSQVQYWEATKFVAKLRDSKMDNNLLLLQTLMQASHGGVSGRYDRYKQVAFEYAFLLNLAQINH